MEAADRSSFMRLIFDAQFNDGMPRAEPTGVRVSRRAGCLGRDCWIDPHGCKALSLVSPPPNNMHTRTHTRDR